MSSKATNKREELISKIAKMSIKSIRDEKFEDKNNWNKNIHCKIHSLDPYKSSWLGEILTVGNAKKYITKFFLFGRDYHVPQSFIEVLKKRTYIQTKKVNVGGNEVTQNEERPAYKIEILKPISEEEYNIIRDRQLVNEVKES